MNELRQALHSLAQKSQHATKKTGSFTSFLFILFLALGWPAGAVLAQTQIGDDIDGETAQDRSGHSVSISADGSRVAIGAPFNDGTGNNAGHVRVYDFTGGAWTQVGDDIDAESAFDQSGFSVSLSPDGSRVAIGAPRNNNDVLGNFAGHVRVYEFSGGTWTQVGDDIDTEADADQNGYSVSLSEDGSRVAIGAPTNDGTANQAGHVRIFDFTGVAWTQVGDDIDGEATQDNTGFSVSLSLDGSRVAIGAPGNDEAGDQAGHARIFDFTGGAWTQIGDDIDGQAAFDNFGASVSLSSDGSRVAVGARFSDGIGSDAGNVRIFEFTGGTWTQVGNDIDGEAANDWSGYSVSLSEDGSRVAVGARQNDGLGIGIDSGHVRIFDFTGGAWTQIGTDIDGEAAFDNFGYSVSLAPDGSRVAVGADLNDGIASNAGNVRIYEIDGPLPVELVDFKGQVWERQVLLSWHTASEQNNLGFYLEQRMSEGQYWREIDFIEGAGTTSETQEYSYNTGRLSAGRHAFRLRQMDFDGKANYSAIIEVYVDLPGTHVLGGAYPNPFNLETRFELTLAEQQDVQIVLFDGLGKEVQMLHNGVLTSGTVHGFRISAEALPSGVYIYQVKGENFTESRRVLLSR